MKLKKSAAGIFGEGGHLREQLRTLEAVQDLPSSRADRKKTAGRIFKEIPPKVDALPRSSTRSQN